MQILHKYFRTCLHFLLPLATEINGCYKYFKPSMLAEKCILSTHQYLAPGKKSLSAKQ